MFGHPLNFRQSPILLSRCFGKKTYEFDNENQHLVSCWWSVHTFNDKSLENGGDGENVFRKTNEFKIQIFRVDFNINKCYQCSCWCAQITSFSNSHLILTRSYQWSYDYAYLYQRVYNWAQASGPEHTVPLILQSCAHAEGNMCVSGACFRTNNAAILNAANPRCMRWPDGAVDLHIQPTNIDYSKEAPWCIHWPPPSHCRCR